MLDYDKSTLNEKNGKWAWTTNYPILTDTDVQKVNLLYILANNWYDTNILCIPHSTFLWRYQRENNAYQCIGY